MPRINELPAVALPLSGSELLPIETAQGTRRVPVAALLHATPTPDTTDTAAALATLAAGLIHAQAQLISIHLSQETTP